MKTNRKQWEKAAKEMNEILGLKPIIDFSEKTNDQKLLEEIRETAVMVSPDDDFSESTQAVIAELKNMRGSIKESVKKTVKSAVKEAIHEAVEEETKEEAKEEVADPPKAGKGGKTQKVQEKTPEKPKAQEKPSKAVEKPKGEHVQPAPKAKAEKVDYTPYKKGTKDKAVVPDIEKVWKKQFGKATDKGIQVVLEIAKKHPEWHIDLIYSSVSKFATAVK